MGDNWGSKGSKNKSSWQYQTNYPSSPYAQTSTGFATSESYTSAGPLPKAKIETIVLNGNPNPFETPNNFVEQRVPTKSAGEQHYGSKCGQTEVEFPPIKDVYRGQTSEDVAAIQPPTHTARLSTNQNPGLESQQAAIQPPNNTTASHVTDPPLFRMVKIVIEGQQGQPKIKKLDVNLSLSVTRGILEKPELFNSFLFTMDKIAVDKTDEFECKLIDILDDKESERPTLCIKLEDRKIDTQSTRPQEPLRVDPAPLKPQFSLTKLIEHHQADVPKGSRRLTGDPDQSLETYLHPRVLPKYDSRLPLLPVLPEHRAKLAKYILLMGESGVGKTTLINAIVNYLYGVKFTDNFRIQLVEEATSKNMSVSQTTDVNMYVVESPLLDFPIVLIDTPGYNDTSGISRDRKTDEQIEELLSEHIHEIHMVCFVAKANTVRITDTQKYVFKKIVSLFGDEITRNLTFLFTFSDNKEPQVSKELMKPGSIVEPMIKKMPADWFIKFNNSSLYQTAEPGESDVFLKLYWDFGLIATEALIRKLLVSEGKRTTNLKDRILKRKQKHKYLQTLVSEAQMIVLEIVEWKESLRFDRMAYARIQDRKKFCEAEIQRLKPPEPVMNYYGGYDYKRKQVPKLKTVPTLLESKVSNLGVKQQALDAKIKQTMMCLEAASKDFIILLQEIKKAKVENAQSGIESIPGEPEHPYLEQAITFEESQKDSLLKIKSGSIRDLETNIKAFEEHLKFCIREEGFDEAWESFKRVHGPKTSATTGNSLKPHEATKESSKCFY